MTLVKHHTTNDRFHVATSDEPCMYLHAPWRDEAFNQGHKIGVIGHRHRRMVVMAVVAHLCVRAVVCKTRFVFTFVLVNATYSVGTQSPKIRRASVLGTPAMCALLSVPSLLAQVRVWGLGGHPLSLGAGFSPKFAGRATGVQRLQVYI